MVRKNRASAETAALLVLQKSTGDMGERLGGLTLSTEHANLIKPQNNGASQYKACEVIGVSSRTLLGWQHIHNATYEVCHLTRYIAQF